MDTETGWLCICGTWIDDGGCCVACGNEPPWGCDCGAHDEDAIEDIDDPEHLP